MKKMGLFSFAVIFSLLVIAVPMPSAKAVGGSADPLVNSSYGFFKAKGATDAIKVLESGGPRGTEIGKATDATSLDLMYWSLLYIEECNDLRARHGLKPLLVSDYAMACAQININWSDTRLVEHASFFPVGENLMYVFGWDNAFGGTYFAERDLYDIGEQWLETRHYLNIIDRNHTVQGFAISLDQGDRPANVEKKVAISHTFYNKGTGTPVAEYKQQLADYIAQIGGTLPDTSAYRPSYIGCYDLEFPKDETGKDETPVYRVFDADTGKWLYTIDRNEALYLVSFGRKTYQIPVGWQAEGISWIAPVKSDKPIYRLFNPATGQHHYTMDKKEIKTLVSKFGWNDEGIKFYPASKKGTPVYRLYNKSTGEHHYTPDRTEINKLKAAGWDEEGISWYGN